MRYRGVLGVTLGLIILAVVVLCKYNRRADEDGAPSAGDADIAHSDAHHTGAHSVIRHKGGRFDSNQLYDALLDGETFSADPNDQLEVVVGAARESKMGYDEVRKALVALLDRTDPSQALVSTEALIDVFAKDVRQRALLEFEKAWILGKRMQATDAAIAFCRERVDAYRKARADSAAMLAILGGDLSRGAADTALSFYLEARLLSDPDIHPEVKPERYGDACYQAAGLLMQQHRYEEADALLTEAIGKINPQSSWLRPCKELKVRLVTRMMRTPE